MADTLRQIIGGQDLVINDKLRVRNPTLREVCDFGEERYLGLLSILVARPYDLMVLLDDHGINYMDVDEFELFILNVQNLPLSDTSFLFGRDLSFSEFEAGENQENGELILYHKERGIVIDRLVYAQIVSFLRECNLISAEIEYKAGNERMRRSLIERARRKQKKNAGKPFVSQFSNIISLMVNLAGFKYDYESVFDLHISQFYDAYLRLNKIESYRQTMSGVYAGTVSYDKLDKKLLDWSGTLMVKQADLDKSKEQLAPTNSNKN